MAPWQVVTVRVCVWQDPGERGVQLPENGNPEVVACAVDLSEAGQGVANDGRVAPGNGDRIGIISLKRKNSPRMYNIISRICLMRSNKWRLLQQQQ